MGRIRLRSLVSLLLRRCRGLRRLCCGGGCRLVRRGVLILL